MARIPDFVHNGRGMVGLVFGNDRMDLDGIGQSTYGDGWQQLTPAEKDAWIARLMREWDEETTASRLEDNGFQDLTQLSRQERLNRYIDLFLEKKSKAKWWRDGF